jgi:hypothetical protein
VTGAVCGGRAWTATYRLRPTSAKRDDPELGDPSDAAQPVALFNIGNGRLWQSLDSFHIAAVGTEKMPALNRIDCHGFALARDNSVKRCGHADGVRGNEFSAIILLHTTALGSALGQDLDFARRV